jgi:hypothetical protein
MNSHTLTPHAPTFKQLSYLRSLAEQTGTTFVSPGTRRDASREIERLRALQVRGRVSFRREPSIAHDPIVYGTAPDGSEISGYGACARWRTTPPCEPQSIRSNAGESTSLSRSKRALARTGGEPVELGRYETQAGEKRALYGIRIEGKPRIIDAAAQGAGRIYTVEEDLIEKGGAREVKGLVANYIAQARQLGRIPMAKTPRK